MPTLRPAAENNAMSAIWKNLQQARKHHDEVKVEFDAFMKEMLALEGGKRTPEEYAAMDEMEVE